VHRGILGDPGSDASIHVEVDERWNAQGHGVRQGRVGEQDTVDTFGRGVGLKPTARSRRIGGRGRRVVVSHMGGCGRENTTKSRDLGRRVEKARHCLLDSVKQ
jgi:hypothetical protein